MKYTLLYMLGLIIVFTSCDKETIVRYEVPIDAEFDIPTGLNTVETHYFIIRNVPTYYKQNADIKGVDTSSIINVVASRGLVKSKFQEVDFDFVERVSIYAVSQKDPTIKREMYYLDFVPLTTRAELRMLSSTTSLRDLLKEEFIDLEVRLNVRSFTRSNIRARIEFGYAVF
ncbi:MAG: hypothetical protein WAU01_03890 [Saprospiraceae bacterium]